MDIQTCKKYIKGLIKEIIIKKSIIITNDITLKYIDTFGKDHNVTLTLSKDTQKFVFVCDDNKKSICRHNHLHKKMDIVFGCDFELFNKDIHTIESPKDGVIGPSLSTKYVNKCEKPNKLKKYVISSAGEKGWERMVKGSDQEYVTASIKYKVGVMTLDDINGEVNISCGCCYNYSFDVKKYIDISINKNISMEYVMWLLELFKDENISDDIFNFYDVELYLKNN